MGGVGGSNTTSPKGGGGGGSPSQPAAFSSLPSSPIPRGAPFSSSSPHASPHHSNGAQKITMAGPVLSSRVSSVPATSHEDTYHAVARWGKLQDEACALARSKKGVGSPATRAARYRRRKQKAVEGIRRELEGGGGGSSSRSSSSSSSSTAGTPGTITSSEYTAMSPAVTGGSVLAVYWAVNTHRPQQRPHRSPCSRPPRARRRVDRRRRLS